MEEEKRNLEIRKNEEYIVDIVDTGFSGEGIAKINGFTVFIPNMLIGEKARIKIVKVVSSHAFGKVLDIIKPDERRIKTDCKTFEYCGGCELRYTDYENTLEIKKNSVINVFKKNYGKDIVIDEVIGMDNPFHYRNKLQFPVGIDKEGNPITGIFKQRTHEIIENFDCKIQNEYSLKILRFIYDFIKENKIKPYDEKSCTGTIRHIIIRNGLKTGDVMVTIVTNEKEIPHEEKLVKEVTKAFPEIKTIVKNINSENTNVILGKRDIVIFGEGYIYDYIGEFKYKISSKSFYQVNPVQTEKLYSKAVEYANLNEDDVIYDLYCGIGTIGIFASKNVKKIYGIETVEEAIKDAKENAEINGIDNTEYFVGDVEEILPKLVKEEKEKPDAVFIDPPRKGVDETVIETLFKIEAKKIVYISCNPATLARDLKALDEKYELKKISLVDMFPYTSHIESVVLLERR